MCVYKCAQMRRRGLLCGRRRLNITAPHSSCLFCIKWKDAQMKGNEEKYMLGEEHALFTHHHRDWSLLPFLSLVSGLNWEILHLKFMHIFLWNVYCAPGAAAQLANVLHFIKKISSQPLSGLETRLFINEPFSLFDFPAYWNEWRQAEIPASSWCVRTPVSSAVCSLKGIKRQKRWANQKASEWVKSLHLVVRLRSVCPPQLKKKCQLINTSHSTLHHIVLRRRLYGRGN